MVNLFWSEKCGCTYIKSLYNFYVRGLKDTRHPHTLEFGCETPFFDPDYRNILVVRNPFDRLISGYIDKYVDGHLTCDIGEVNFEEFVEIFVQYGHTKIDYDHFSPQFSRAYHNDMVFHKIYDIDHFDDADFIDQFHVKKTNYDPSVKLSKSYYEHDHTNANRTRVWCENVFDKPYQELRDLKRSGYVPFYRCFYDDRLLETVRNLYLNDFTSLEKYGFYYKNATE